MWGNRNTPGWGNRNAPPLANRNRNTVGWGNRNAPPLANRNRNINQWGNRNAFTRRKTNTPVSEKKVQTISILAKPSNFNIYNFIPRDFTLCTKNSSGKFNRYLLTNCSSIILQHYTSDPNNFKYTLEIDDNQNIIEKLEKLFQGQSVNFDQNEISICKIIKAELNLTIFPDLQDLVNPIRSHPFLRVGVANTKKFTAINIYQRLNMYSKSDHLKSFTIQTKKAEYKVNFFGIHSSSVIRDFLNETANSDRYNYDYEDEGNGFQYICDFFNFKTVELSINNCQIIKEICEDLKIDFILNEIDDFIKKIETISQTIDDKQDMIDKIDDIFDLLYNIKEKGVNDVADSIEESVWSQSENDVMELAAVIFQVIQTKIELHPYLIDLLVKLNESENSNLKTLLSFFNKMLLKMAFKMPIKNLSLRSIIPFIYLMYKHEIIPKEKIISKINNNNIGNTNIVSWFFPELTACNKIIPNDIKNHLLYPADPDHIEEYKRMRDKGEYEDEIATSLRNDDIDTFQKIIIQMGEKALKNKVKITMFEPIMERDLSFLNYAAWHGAVKCFKYLLLNDEKIDSFTFKFAVISGNTELIRIIYNEKSMSEQKSSIYLYALNEAIKLHQNDIFDWILEQKLSDMQEYFFNLMICSVENCNAHSIVKLIDNGFNIFDYESKLSQIIETASERGFYSLVDMIIQITNHKKLSIDIRPIISFGNLMIFKLVSECLTLDQDYLESALNLAIKNDFIEFVKYFFETYVNKEFKFNDNNSNSILFNSIHQNSNEILNFLIDEITKLSSISIISYFELLNESIKYKKNESSQKLANLIYQKNNGTNFTDSFLLAVNENLAELVKYMLDNKYIINFSKIVEYISKCGTIIVEIYSMIINNVDSNGRKIMLECINKAIHAKNKPLVKYVLDNGGISNSSLIEAVIANDFELVEMVLEKNSSPSFVNINLQNGTALFIATKNNNLQICKKLLSIPGINPNIYNDSFTTPLINSVCNFNVEIFDLLIQFYGDDIENLKWQLEKAIDFCFVNQNTISLTQLCDILNKIIKLNVINLNNHYSKTSFLIFACQNKLNDVVKNLINYESIDLNIYEPSTGDTPLIISIKNKNEEITKLLIENNKTNINQKNYKLLSPIILAASLNQGNIVDLLLKNDRFNPDKSDINIAFFLSNLTESRKFFSFKSLDVNFVDISKRALNPYYCFKKKNIVRTKLIDCIIQNDTELFDFIVHHPSFDKSQNNIAESICVAINEKKSEMIQKLLELPSEFDINSCLYNNNSLLISVLIDKMNYDIISLILNNPKFDSKKSEIYRAFVISYFKYGKNENQKLKQSQQTETTTKQVDNSELFQIVKLIFEYDCKHDNLINLNKPVNNPLGYPLEEAIKMNSNEFANLLINSNKIDFNVKIPNRFSESEFTTYLHLAVIYEYRSSIIKEILSKKLIDINVTNDLGETPLFEACRYQRVETIKLLFENDDLDFLHKNNKGEDAIEIARSLFECENSDELNDLNNKDNYLNELLKIIGSGNDGPIFEYAFTHFDKTKNILKKEENKIKTRWPFGVFDQRNFNNENKIKAGFLSEPSKQNENINEKEENKTKQNENINDKEEIKAKQNENINDKEEIKAKQNEDTNEKEETKSKQNENINEKEENKSKQNENINEKEEIETKQNENINDKEEIKAKQNENINDKEEIKAKQNEDTNEKEETEVKQNGSINEKEETEVKQNGSINEKEEIKTKQNENINEKEERKTRPDFSSKPLKQNESANEKVENNTNPVFTVNSELYNENEMPKEKNQFNFISQTSKSPVSQNASRPNTKFCIHNESFSAEPDPSFQHKFNSHQSDKIELFNRRRKSPRKIEEFMNDDYDDFSDEENRKIRHHKSHHHHQHHHYQDQNQIMLLQQQQQQQQQWLQMIKINNDLQNQINMHFMNQAQMLKKKEKKIKRSQK